MASVHKLKLLVILICSGFWMIVCTLRAPDSVGTAETIGLDASWVVGLAATLQQGQVSGRDFQFTYGPAAQALAALGAYLNRGSPVSALPMIILVFSASAILLCAVLILLITEIDWRQTVLIYLAAALLNLFSEPTSFRPLLVLVCAAVLARALSARRRLERNLTSVAAGVLGVLAQLTTAELGLYALFVFVAVPGGLAILRLLRHSLHVKGNAGFLDYVQVLAVTVGSYVAGNVLVSISFALSSREYGPLFQYQQFAVEMMRGYNRTMGAPWSLSGPATAGLLVVTLYTLTAVVLSLRHSALEENHLYLCLSMMSLVLLKSAMLRSDVGHITVAFGPLVFIFLLLGQEQLRNRWSRVIWLLLLAVLVSVWPWAGNYAVRDVGRMLAGGANPLSKLVSLHRLSAQASDVLPAGLQGNLFKPGAPILSFPYQTYIGIALNHPIAAPALQGWAAGTILLQNYYVHALDARPDLVVIYGLDEAASPAIDSVQDVTRSPIIFKYLYRNFELASTHRYGRGFYVLKRRAVPVEMVLDNIAFESDETNTRTTEIRLPAPVSCSLIGLTVEMTYSAASLIGRAAPVAVTILESEAPVLRSRLIALRERAPFDTMLALTSLPDFYTIFGEKSSSGRRWDKIRFQYLSADYLDIPPDELKVLAVHCVKPAAAGAEGLVAPRPSRSS